MSRTPHRGAVRLRDRCARQIAVVVVALVALVLTEAARADFRIVEFETHASSYEAGAHADVTTKFSFPIRGHNDFGQPIPDGVVHRLQIDMPQGLVGDPTKFPRCTRDAFVLGMCPPATQVGVADILLPIGFAQTSGVYNLEPSANEPALFGVELAPTIVSYIRIKVRPDGGLTAVVEDLPYVQALLRNELTLWGVPADHNGSGAERRPFMANPTECTRVPVTTLRAWSYDQSDPVHVARSTNNIATGCDTLQFAPTMTAVPTERAAGAPTGLDVTITVPQSTVPDGRATAHVRSVAIALPEGMTVSPSSANGLDACAPDQFGYKTDAPVRCPDASKIGTVSIDSPLMSTPLRGSVYLAKQNDNPFSSLLALYIAVRAQGVTIKLAGRVDPDPVTGRLTTTFDDNPQLPFSRLDLSLKSGPRAPLVNPQRCGTYESETRLTSWAGHVVSDRTAMVIDRDCAPVGFAPSFEAGTVNPVGGSPSTFSLTFGRGDHDEELRDVTVQMPEGLTGVVASAAVCPNALADAGACAEDSRIGSVTTAAGPGATPYYLPGRVYLTEGIDGAPYGLSIVVPAVAGPLDLGTVVVRAAIHVDRRTAALRVASKPMPRILQGIVLHIRKVNVSIDKPGFMLNPTSCSVKEIAGVVGSHAGSQASVRSRFQAGDCARLRLQPRMSLRVGTRRRTRRHVTTPLTVTLRQTAGQGNLKFVQVNLPRYLATRTEVVNVRVACTPEQYEADRCPMQIGTATAVTPLLRQPLEGRVFLVRNPERRLPDMMVKLRGQGDARLIQIDLTGKITIPRDLTLRTTFDTVPDVPIRSFQLRLVAGRNGAVMTTRNLCLVTTRRQRARLRFRGQNGKLVQRQQRLRVNGCARRRGAAARRARRQARRAQVRRTQVHRAQAQRTRARR